MLIDLTLLVTKYANREALENEKMASFGHLGTHFDVMDKEFPLEYLNREAVAFDVKGLSDREIGAEDIDLDLVKPGMFAAFHTGFIEEVEYGSKEYFGGHPQLSNDLIECLLVKQVAIIGVDFAGLRRGAEHTPKDQYCADRGAFVVENLTNLGAVLQGEKHRLCTIHTYPIKFAGLTGLPCRVAAEI
ncbi:MAG: cyclase family protein [Anaerolineaceae bacterium]